MSEPEQQDASPIPSASAEGIPESPDGPVMGSLGEPAVRGRFAVILILLMVGLADVSLYHAVGYAGPAVFLVGAAVLLAVGIPRRSVRPGSLCLAALLSLLSWRLAWQGSFLQIVVGFWLLHALVLAFRRQTPFVLETLVFAAQSIPGGYDFFSRINDRVHQTLLGPVDEGRTSRMVDVLLPVVAAVVFGGIFVMANPDMAIWVSGRLGDIVMSVRDFLFQFSVYEVLFWCVVAWLTGGLLRPVLAPVLTSTSDRDAAAWGVEESPLYQAFRNTLVTVILLFVVYLVFEFQTLWFRTFPEGFYYAGYAHEGAAWLTVALALATLMLSLMFRGRTLCDPRLARLRRLAWIWSVLNFVLAAAVYNRMVIYIDFNGMTRMRTVGLLGITSVVGGFVLVLVKINRSRDFLWLIRRQLWVAGLAVYLFVVLPVDTLIHEYNVRRVMSGDLPPIVQVTGHPVSDEALTVLLPLCNSSDERIRSGIQALLSRRLPQLRTASEMAAQQGWTARQWSREQALAVLAAEREASEVFTSVAERDAAWQRLQEYAYQNWW
ncbi:MAG: DUF4153 domain-containing protein [Fuerstiella sp.]